MDANDMKVVVYYEKAAIVTFNSDCHLKFGEDMALLNVQISLAFVKNNEGEWSGFDTASPGLRIKIATY